MEARIKSLVLPEAPKYEGNVGSSAWTRPWYETEKDLIVVTVSPRQEVLPKKRVRRRKPGRPHTGGRPVVTEEEIKQIMALYSAGVPRKEIAERTRRPYSTINKWIRALEEKARQGIELTGR